MKRLKSSEPLQTKMPPTSCLAAEEVGGFDRFLYEAAQNFEVFSNIQD
jgi:hypothetical protein